MTLIPINLHRNADEAAPYAALVDDELAALAAPLRWMTLNGAAPQRPFRPAYDAANKRSRPVSLAHWVWRQVNGELPEKGVIAHQNADLLDCRSANLAVVASCCKARSNNTGKSVRDALDGVDIVGLREKYGFTRDAAAARRGRRPALNAAETQQLRELFTSVGAGLSLAEFNAQVVVAEIGHKVPISSLRRALA